MEKYQQTITTLRRIDELLATPGGLRRELLADELQISSRQVHRAIKAIEHHGLAVESLRVNDENGGYHYVYRYTNRRRRLFTLRG